MVIEISVSFPIAAALLWLAGLYLGVDLPALPASCHNLFERSQPQRQAMIGIDHRSTMPVSVKSSEGDIWKEFRLQLAPGSRYIV